MFFNNSDPKIMHFRGKFFTPQVAAQNINTKRQALEAFQATLDLFEEQIDLLRSSEDKVFPHERIAWKGNSDYLLSRKSAYQLDQQKETKELRVANDKSRQLDREMIALKPEVIRLYKQRQHHATWLVDHGKKLTDINRLLEQWTNEMMSSPASREHGPGSMVRVADAADAGVAGVVASKAGSGLEYLPHNDESSWYFPNVDRASAERLLFGTPHGSFLIRRSRDGHHALSIMCNGCIEHCKIEQTERGFGFAEPYNIYADLKELVLHYSQNSLEEYNESLTTKLDHPVRKVTPQQHRLAQGSAYV